MMMLLTIIIYLLISALTVNCQVNNRKGKPEPEKIWFEGGNGNLQWSFGCGFPSGGLLAVDVNKIKKNESSTCPSLCYDDNRCTHFIYMNGYCYLKMFKFVEASPKAAIYNNPGGLCGFVVERPDVVKKWSVGSNGRIRWSTNCEYPNVKYNMYTENKFLPMTKCGDHCLSIKRCTHFGYLFGMCWVKDYRGAPIVQTSDKKVPLCGFIPERQDAAKQRTKSGTVSSKRNNTIKPASTTTHFAVSTTIVNKSTSSKTRTKKD